MNHAPTIRPEAGWKDVAAAAAAAISQPSYSPRPSLHLTSSLSAQLRKDAIPIEEKGAERRCVSSLTEEYKGLAEKNTARRETLREAFRSPSVAHRIHPSRLWEAAGSQRHATEEEGHSSIRCHKRGLLDAIDRLIWEACATCPLRMTETEQ
ncbi:hypothetical protein MTO96_031587 [Rhipicephalus appendiculatus]